MSEGQEQEQEVETVEVDGVQVPKEVATKLQDQGRLQAVNSIKSAAARSGLEGSDNMRPTQIINHLTEKINGYQAQVSELEKKIQKLDSGEKGKSKDVEDRMRQWENEKLSEFQQKEKKLLQDVALRDWLKDIRAEAKQHFSLTEEGSLIYESMLQSALDFDLVADNSGEQTQYKVLSKKKGQEEDFYVESRPAQPKDIARYIAEKFPSMHTIVPDGTGPKNAARGRAQQNDKKGLDRFSDKAAREAVFNEVQE